MSVQHQQWIKIDEIINSYLDRSEQSIHKYSKCWQIGFDGMQQLGLDFFYQIKSVRLPINANKTVSLPPDYLNYSKVGIFNERGETVPLRYNNKLTTYADLLPDRFTKTEGFDLDLYGNYYWGSQIFYNYWNGNVVTNLYGVPSGAPFIGTFKVDDANGVILLGENFCWDSIVLEYIACPAQGDTYYVPFQFKEALMWYIAWQDISFLPNTRKGNMGDKEQRRRNFFNERRLAYARYEPFYLDEAYQQSVENTRMTVKT